MKKCLLFIFVVMIAATSLWGQYTGTGIFEKITDKSDISSDSYYVIYGIFNEGTHQSEGALTNTTAGAGRLYNTPESSVPFNPSGEIVNPDEGIVWRIVDVMNSGYQIYNEASNLYLGIAENTDTSLKLYPTNPHLFNIDEYDARGFKITTNYTPGVSNDRAITLNGTDWVSMFVAECHKLELYKVIEETLPVTLTSFMAIQTSENFAEIAWTTESETELLGYNLYRNETKDSATAVKVNHNIIEATNSTQGSSYSYVDEEVQMNTTYYYWLEMNEFNGIHSFEGPYEIRINEDYEIPGLVLPTKTTLESIYPNPFNPTTAISFYHMGQADNVKINVYNMKGQLINNLVDRNFDEGNHEVVWNGKDANGKDCSSGIYFFRMESKSNTQTIKGILMK